MNLDDWWPDLHFGPVNLWTLVPAEMFYASQEEQWRMVWCEHTKQYVSISKTIVINSPIIRRMSVLTSLR